MSPVRYDEEVANPAAPAVVACAEKYPSVQHVDGGLARAFMLGLAFAFAKGDHGLPQLMFVAPEDSSGAATAGQRYGVRKFFTCKGGQ
ncbi:MAG: hypothetical protein KF761_14195 [Salinibacterium sp.]|nr:hypothetical protein [Salinibacterium sp.]